MRSIVRRLAHLLRFVTSWVFAVVLVCAVVAALYYHHRVDQEVRNHIQAMLARQYPELSISLGSARVINGEGIRLRELSVVRPAEKNGVGPRAELAFADEIFLHCNPSMTSLLEGQVSVKHVRVRGLMVRPTRGPDGTWNLAKLLPLPRVGDVLPTASITEATVEVIDRRNNPPSVFAFENIHLAVAPRSSESAQRGNEVVARQSATQSRRVRVSGSVSSDHFRRAALTGEFDIDGAGWSLEGTVTDLQYTPELRRGLPAELSRTLDGLDGLRARATFSFAIASNATSAVPLRFSINGNIQEGRFEDRRLQHALTELFATVHCDNNGWRIVDLQANHGEAQIQLSAQRDGHAPESPLQLEGEVRNFTLTRRLIDNFPATLQAAWRKYQPLGLINSSFRVGFDGRHWSATAGVECLDVSLLYQDLPYPLHSARGQVTLREQWIGFDLWALANTTPVHLVGEVADPGPAARGVVAVSSNGWLSLNDALVSVLGPTIQNVVRSLQGRGLISFSARLERSERTGGVIAREVDIDVADGWLQYQHFPYPLQRVRGRLRLRGDRWDFINLRGYNDSCYVTCEEGSWDPQRTGGQLQLMLVATDVPCDDELRDALPLAPRQLWQGLRPLGTIDHVRIELTHRAGAPRPQLQVVATQLVHKDDPERRSLVIQPQWFPYRMDQVTGAMHYRDGHVEMRNLRARHGGVEISARGDGVVGSDGRWRVTLHRLSADRLRADRELLAALPAALGGVLTTMKFTGLLGLDGAIQFTGVSNEPATPVSAAWQLSLDVDTGRLNFSGLDLEQVFGRIDFSGHRSGGQFSNAGHLHLDSVMCKGIQLQQVQGPWSMTPSHLVLGSPLTPLAGQQGQATEPSIRAQVFGGTVKADAQVSLLPEGQFSVAAELTNADVAEIAREFTTRHQVTGRAFARLQLAGSTQGAHTLEGLGDVRLRGANIYRLPAVISLLDELRVRETGPGVFTSSDVDFRIQGDIIYFDRFDLHGESLTLKGYRGEMGLDRHLNLDFYTIVGGEKRWVPFMRPLVGEASRQFLRIHITGTPDDLRMRREVLPALNETLQQLFPELARPSAAGGDPPPPRPFLSSRRLGLQRR